MPGVLLEVEGEHDPSFSADIEQDAAALMDAAKAADAQLSLVLCHDAHIHAVNLQWRGVDKPTDVLSFPMDDEDLLGDLVVSVETAARQAAENVARAKESAEAARKVAAAEKAHEEKRKRMDKLQATSLFKGM